MSSHWNFATAGDFAVIGDPVEHSKSPQMQQAAFDAAGLSYSYRAWRVPASEFVEAVERLADLGYVGLNVTVPNKEAAYRWCDKLDAEAVRVSGVNTLDLKKRAGTNTDLDGFIDTLRNLLTANRTALVLGAGGSARAVLAALADCGYTIRVWNRTRQKAAATIDEMRIDAEVCEQPALQGCGLIVNATSAGIAGRRIEMEWNQAMDSAIAYDLMYGRETQFMAEARNRGLKVVDGSELLVAQGARSFEWWLRKPAPRDAMRDALRP